MCTCIDGDHISLCIVWLLSMLVLPAYMYESVYGKSAHISLCESMSKFVKILVRFISYENR